MEIPHQQVNLNESVAESQLNREAENASSEEVQASKPELTKSEVIEKLQTIAQCDAEAISRDEVSMLKQVFYSIRRHEIEAAKKQFVENGNQPEAFEAAADPDEEALKEALNIIKEKKAALAARLESEREENLSRKTALIEEIKQLGTDTDNVNRNFPRFREIQQEFKAAGEVPP
ncbi:MAG: DUF349 domain-containing protein, partial [Muribaculaceae bacterium]|nr:DUF349 domain-containing protein [Muribaculaceae bacterium]